MLESPYSETTMKLPYRAEPQFEVIDLETGKAVPRVHEVNIEEGWVSQYERADAAYQRGKIYQFPKLVIRRGRFDLRSAEA